MRVALEAPPLLPARTARARRRRRAPTSAATVARVPWLPPRDGRDRRAPLRDLLLDHHDPEPLPPADGRLRPRHREQPGLERRPLERAAVQDVRADRRPDVDAHRPSRDVHLVSDRHPLPAGAAARDAAGAAVAADRRRRAAAVRVRAPPPGRVDGLPGRRCCSCSTRRCTGRTCTTSTTCRSRRSSCGRRWRCWRRAAIAGRPSRSC